MLFPSLKGDETGPSQFQIVASIGVILISASILIFVGCLLTLQLGSKLDSHNDDVEFFE